MSDRLLKESDVMRIALQLPLVINSAFADAVKALPSVGRPQEWIPCSERLPSELSDDERVLATTDVDEMGVIIMPVYDVKSWYRKGYTSAWMPLPKPWKGAKR